MTTDPFDQCLRSMRQLYQEDPVKAVRGQGFIKLLHEHLAHDVQVRLSNAAVKDGVEVKKEATLFGFAQAQGRRRQCHRPGQRTTDDHWPAQSDELRWQEMP